MWSSYVWFVFFAQKNVWTVLEIKWFLGNHLKLIRQGWGTSPACLGNCNCPWNLISHYILLILKAIAISFDFLLDFCCMQSKLLLRGTACPPFLEDALPFCPFGTFPHTVGNHPSAKLSQLDRSSPTALWTFLTDFPNWFILISRILMLFSSIPSLLHPLQQGFPFVRQLATNDLLQ